MTECLRLRSRLAALREGLGLVKEEAMRMMKERDTALAELQRVKKAKSEVEFELWEKKRGFRVMDDLIMEIDSELDSVREVPALLVPGSRPFPQIEGVKAQK